MSIYRCVYIYYTIVPSYDGVVASWYDTTEGRTDRTECEIAPGPSERAAPDLIRDRSQEESAHRGGTAGDGCAPQGGAQ